ncbi:MAG: hypothetical protein ACKVQU_06950 [Burkholderiales bacterium]
MRNMIWRSSDVVRTAALSVAFALVASCASFSPPQPNRVYERILPPDLYTVLEKVFADAGYQVNHRDTHRGYFQTAWKESDRAGGGAVSGRERRMYSALFDVELLHRRSTLYLTLVAEVRSPANDSWTASSVVRNEDPEFNRILDQLDHAVRDRGGQGAPVKGGAGR